MEKASHTFERVAREWHGNKAPSWSKRTADNTLRRLELDIFPEIGQRPMHAIKHRELIDALRKIERRGANEVQLFLWGRWGRCNPKKEKSGNEAGRKLKAQVINFFFGRAGPR